MVILKHNIQDKDKLSCNNKGYVKKLDLYITPIDYTFCMMPRRHICFTQRCGFVIQKYFLKFHSE